MTIFAQQLSDSDTNADHLITALHSSSFSIREALSICVLITMPFKLSRFTHHETKSTAGRGHLIEVFRSKTFLAPCMRVPFELSSRKQRARKKS